MREDEVPQDNISTYAGQQKIFYAVTREGDYTSVRSSGWEVEGEATKDALRLINQDRLAAWHRGQSRQSSPLEYHMYNRRMDLGLLSQATGLFKWRIRRHFRPSVFANLSDKLIARYCEALELSPEELSNLPETPPND